MKNEISLPLPVYTNIINKEQVNLIPMGTKGVIVEVHPSMAYEVEFFFEEGNVVETVIHSQIIEDKFTGVDASLEISLFEYGFIARPHTDDYEDEFFVVYKKRDNVFDTAYIQESFLNDLIEGKEWADDEDIVSFLSCVDSTKEEWLKAEFCHKLSECLSYWGQENIFGSSYYQGMTEAEVEAKYLTLDLF